MDDFDMANAYLRVDKPTSDPAGTAGRIVDMDLLVGLNAAVLVSAKRAGFWARLRRVFSPKSAFEKAFERLSEMADLIRIDAARVETHGAALAVARELVDTLGRFSHSTAVHFMPSVPNKAKPSIHFMAAPGQPGALVVKTWQPDSPGGKAVVAKIFKMPAQNVKDFVSELETLVVRARIGQGSRPDLNHRVVQSARSDGGAFPTCALSPFTGARFPSIKAAT